MITTDREKKLHYYYFLNGFLNSDKSYVPDDNDKYEKMNGIG
jgi:hypothetical protein